MEPRGDGGGHLACGGLRPTDFHGARPSSQWDLVWSLGKKPRRETADVMGFMRVPIPAVAGWAMGDTGRGHVVRDSGLNGASRREEPSDRG